MLIALCKLQITTPKQIRYQLKQDMAIAASKVQNALFRRHIIVDPLQRGTKRRLAEPNLTGILRVGIIFHVARIHRVPTACYQVYVLLVLLLGAECRRLEFNFSHCTNCQIAQKSIEKSVAQPAVCGNLSFADSAEIPERCKLRYLDLRHASNRRQKQRRPCLRPMRRHSPLFARKTVYMTARTLTNDAP